MTVIAHENFEAVIKAAKDPKSVLSKFTYIELDEEDIKSGPSTVVQAKTLFDAKQEEIKEAAKTEVEKKSAEVVCDARKAA